MDALERHLAEARVRRRLPEARLRRLVREGAGLTQRQLAEAVGVSTPTLSRYESGKLTPRGQTLTRYSYALGRLAREATVEPHSEMRDPAGRPGRAEAAIGCRHGEE